MTTTHFFFPSLTTSIIYFKEEEDRSDKEEVIKDKTSINIMTQKQQTTISLQVKNLSYAYPMEPSEIIKDFTLELPKGSRCLLSGANGAGKSTLLQILAGKTMVAEDKVRVLGRPPFHDFNLSCSGELSYLGSQWRRNVGSAGGDVPLAGDFPARQMIFGVENLDPERRERLIKLLDIDLNIFSVLHI